MAGQGLRVDVDYVRGGVAASAQTWIALDVMTWCDFFKVKGYSDDEMEAINRQTSLHKRRCINLRPVCDEDVTGDLHSPGGREV